MKNQNASYTFIIPFVSFGIFTFWVMATVKIYQAIKLYELYLQGLNVF